MELMERLRQIWTSYKAAVPAMSLTSSFRQSITSTTSDTDSNISYIGRRDAVAATTSSSSTSIKKVYN